MSDRDATAPLIFVCIGGAVLDRKFHLLRPAVLGTSNPAGEVSTHHGGVARNVAENLVRLGATADLVTCVGDDDAGVALLSWLHALGVGAKGVRILPGATSAQYTAVLNPDHDLALGVAAMEILSEVGADDVAGSWPRHPSWVFCDCNLRSDVLAGVIARAAADRTPLAVDAVSAPKVERLPADLTGVRLLFVNRDEARSWAVHHGHLPPGSAEATDDVTLARELLAAGAGTVILTLGADGALVTTGDVAQLVPAVPAQVVDVTGAGDALVAGTLLLMAEGRAAVEAVRGGVAVAALTVQVRDSVRRGLTRTSVAAMNAEPVPSLEQEHR